MTLEQEPITSRSYGTARESMQPSAPVMEERVSVLVGDRLCHKCGYNLTGQHVLREPHYRMLIVRCPECATVASVQEYPLLGRWANRWAMVLAGLCMIVLVGVWIGSGALIFGISYGVSEISADRYRSVIDRLYMEAQQSGQLQGAAVSTPPIPTTIQIPGQPAIVIQNMPGTLSNSFGNWWDGQDKAAIFDQAGGWLTVVEWRSLWIWIPFALAAFLLGCAWSVMLMARRGVSLIAAGAGVLFVAAFFAFFPMYEWFVDPSWSPGAAARAEISPVFLVASIVFAGIPLAMGLMLGRRVARGLVWLMLPPRLCSSLALLWTVDGLNPPRNPALKS